VPVVASSFGGIPEHVTDGVDGVLVRDRGEDAWRRAVDQLLDDAVALRLGNGAYDTWTTRFSPGQALESLLGIYATARSSWISGDAGTASA
jgi:glycosyltransferase involved in cell wall biosynthesis